MTTDQERDEIMARLLGDELVQAVEAYTVAPSAITLSTFCAALIGRCTSAMASVASRVLERMDRLEQRDGD